ncbi:MAG: DMT family transporter [Saccharospirillum sp.]
MTVRTLLVAAGFAALANFFWATNAIVGKLVVTGIPAFTLSQFRWLLAFVLIAPFGLPQIWRQRAWYRQHLGALVVLSVLSVTLYNTLQYWALVYTQPVNIGAMAALMPVMIFVLSGLLGQGKLSGAQWGTALLAILGAWLVLTDGRGVLGLGGDGLIGDGIFFIALICWSFYSVVLKTLPTKEINGVGLLTFLIGVGTIGIVPFWLSGAAAGEVLWPPVSLLWAVGYVAVFPSLVSFFCWIQAVSIGNANVAGLMMTTAPLFNALLTLLVLRQPVSGGQWLGIALVIAGVAGTLMLARRLSLPVTERR